MKSNAARNLFLAFAAGGFYQECFAMAPDYVGIGQLFLTALGVVGLVFAGVGAGIAQNRAKGALVGVGVYVALLAGTFAWMSVSSKAYNRGIGEMVADRKATTERTVAIMQERCKSDERFVVNRTVAVGSSVFVNLNPDSKPPTAAGAPTITPTTAMKEQQRKYGHSFPPIGNEEQYQRAISWIEDADRPETIAELMRTDLVDARDRFKTYGKMYYRFATKQRWLKDGLSDIAIAYTEKYIDDYKFRNWPDGKFKQRIPIDQPGAQYVFTVEDISSLEDRKDWLARGRIRLLEASSSDVIAEYVGFQSLLQKTAVCPNAVKEAANPRGEWDMLRFFFGRIIQQ